MRVDLEKCKYQEHNENRIKKFSPNSGEQSCQLQAAREKSIFVTKGGGNGGGRFWPIIDEIKAGPLTNYTLLPTFVVQIIILGRTFTNNLFSLPEQT